ncbi:hypothetical protein IU486_03980 [Streptomyces gardneri]|uniref:hypothetical protein n=1 Tax=Nocardia TaxID=1817 RepID=UPI00135CC955|nr:MULTISPECIES: hypothetical protein [Nocardia]MBF6163932.1 hypothetical protein [Streptomyces gardneri]MBF6203508.1 hypothetical protein [Streptomyces gardneri]UAK33573.1 hypothetical protein K8O92_06405 [Nocardia asteroides]
MTTVIIGLTLAVAGAPAASAFPGQPATAGSVASPVDSGSSSGSGYLLEAALNALCALTGSRPTCWGSVPSV